MSLPIAGCSFDDLMFWKKKNNGEDTPAEQEPSGEEPAAKTVTGISAVHTKEEIEKGKELLVSEVDLDLSYSDGTSGSAKAERVSLDTSSVGTKTGTAFYGQFFKDFTIEVVEPAVKTIIEITEVHAPGTIEQNGQLALDRVTLDVKYSDGTTDEGIHPESISLVTSALGEVTGTVFVGNVFKTFTITVVEQESPDINPVEITSVITPESIVQDEVLLASNISLKILFSDGSEATLAATDVDFDSSKTGTIEGTAYYNDLSSKFSLLVTPKSEDTSKSFGELRNSILTNHNYTLGIESYYQNFQDERYDGYLYNISNKAYFGTDPNYLNLWDSGFIKVKDQGIAHFYWSITNKAVMLDTFASTNPDRTIYDIESLMVEFLLESSELVKVSDTHYTCSNQKLIGMIANFSGLELAYISNPASLDIYKSGNELKIEAIYTANYYDEESLDPIENEPVYLGVTIKNIDETHNEVIEAFVEDSSKKVPDVTAWDEECLKAFDDHFDDFVPPFPTGASYTFYGFYDWDGPAQKNYIKCQDIASGDLTESYASQLGAVGFELEEDGVYRRRVENEEHTLESIYEARFTYYGESGEYGGHTYGYYYKGGVFQVEFCYYTKLIEAVTSIESLNFYISTTAASEIVPVFPEEYNSAKVSNFDDRTEAVNQQYPDSVLFATSSTGLFKIHIADYADALDFYTELVSRAQAKGFTSIAHGSGLYAGIIIATDYAGSKITLTDMESVTADTYNGYLVCQIYIYNNYTLTYSVTLNKDDGVSSAHITSPSNYMKVEEGTKVTFTVSIADGYELDEITSSVEGVVPTEEGEGTYSFNMPAHDITLNVVTKSKAADEGLEYDREYLVYVGRTDNQQYYTRPTEQGSNKLHFIFKSDGTGTFTYTWFNSAGNVNAGPYTVEFNYTLIDGKFVITCTDGSNNALFGNFRLFSAGEVDNYNETGIFDSGEITITLSNGSTKMTEVTLK